MFGTAMGSPLSPILADYVMEDLVDCVIRKLNFNVPVLKKYVDDFFIILPASEVQNTLTIFNQYNPHLQFTVEMEENGKIPFLDTLVIRKNDQTMTTRWYSKPIASGRLLNFHSFHPTSMKINVATNLIKRVSLLTTSTTIEQQKHIIFQQLRQNNYPSTLINRLINNARNWSSSNETSPHHRSPPPNQPPTNPTNHSISTSSTHQNIHQTNNDQPVQQAQHIQLAQNPAIFKYRSLANIPVLTQSLSAILKKDYSDVKIAPRTIKTTRSLLPPVKDPILPSQQHNIIYSIPCSDCEKVYIGMTTNQLKKRLSGHRSNINKLNVTPLPLENINAKTALIQHMADHQHSFNLDSTKIVDRSLRSSSLPMLEMCHIQNTPNTVNYRTDVDGLNATYAGILHTVKNNISRREQMNSNRLTSSSTHDTQNTQSPTGTQHP